MTTPTPRPSDASVPTTGTPASAAAARAGAGPVREGAVLRVFDHLSAPKGDLYRAVMGVFAAQKRRFVVHLRPDDVASALAGTGVGQGEVEAALEALTAWGNLRADPDTSRVGSLEDFYRRRMLYQLTREGEAAERALAVFETEVGRRGELQTVALEDIRVRLRALAALAPDLPAAAAADPAVVHNLLLEITARLDQLAANAAAFMGSLQRVIDLQELDDDAFLAYKDRLVAYLERFVSELQQKSYDIRLTLTAFDAPRREALLVHAARREALDAVPEGPDDDPQRVVAHLLEQWRVRLSGLDAWFVGTRAHPGQSELLRRRAVRAVPDLLAAIRLLQERRTGRSDRSADYRTLARWFAQADADDAHRLWRAVFGLAPARHLGGLPTGTAADDTPATVPAGTSWLDAPTVQVAARLRRTGHYQRRGQPAKVVDRSAERAVLAARLAAEHAAAERARQVLATGVELRLGDLGGAAGLGRAELALFLRLLGDVLAAGRPDAAGRLRTTTSDGLYEVVLTPVPGGDVVQVRSSEGVVWAPDHTVTVVDRTVPPGHSTADAAPAPVRVHP